MRKIRKLKGLTQNYIANEIGVSQVYISKLENGEVCGLTVGKLLNISKVLDVCPTELLRDLIKCDLKYKSYCRRNLWR